MTSAGLYQEEFILAIIAGAVIAIGALAYFFRRTGKEVRLAMFGLVFTIGFVVVRAASFHHVDRFLKSSVFGARWNWILELTGIAIVALAAYRHRRRKRRR